MTKAERRNWTPQGKSLINVSCNLCQSSDYKLLAIENGLKVVKCRQCGLIYVTPQPIQEELKRFYAQYYPEVSEELWYLAMHRLFKADAKRIERVLGRKGKLLDIGSGFGHFLVMMRERGWEVAGVEPSKLAREMAIKKGLIVYEDRFEDVKPPKRDFDVITAWFLLEHVPDPLGFLKKAYSLLKKGGYIFVRVPNIDFLSIFFFLRRFERFNYMKILLRKLRRDTTDENSLFYAIDPPAHLFGYNKGTLKAMFKAAGFEKIKVINEKMVYRGTMLNHFIDYGIYFVAECLRFLSLDHLCLSPILTVWGIK